MYEFDEDRSLTARGDGVYQGMVSPRWNVGPVPNGGYVLGLAMAALERELEGLEPVTVTGHYLRPTAPGAIEAVVDTAKRGRTYSTASVVLRQGDRETFRGLATYGRLESLESPRYVDGRPPDVDRDACIVWSGGDSLAPEISRRFESRIEPAYVEALKGARAQHAALRGWIRFADGRPVDVHCLGLIADAFPPPVFMVTDRGWVPTIELTVHVRGRPVSEWLCCAFRTRFVFDGLLEEDGEIWDESGRLVALSRQLAGVPRSAVPRSAVPRRAVPRRG